MGNGRWVKAVRWKRVEQYLRGIGFSPEVGKDTFIPENVFYRLAMKAKNEAAEKFQAKIADEIIPAIRKYGAYIAPGVTPHGVEAAALQAVLQPFATTMEALTAAVQTLNQRMDAMEQGRAELKALPPGGEGVSSTPGIASQRRWMRAVNEKLDLLSTKFGKSNNAILHRIYQDMEEEFEIVMDDERYRIMEEQGLEKCSVLAAIFFDEDLRNYFQQYIDYSLAPENRGW